jgi:hypothetical protein
MSLLISGELLLVLASLLAHACCCQNWFSCSSIVYFVGAYIGIRVFVLVVIGQYNFDKGNSCALLPILYHPLLPLSVSI